MGVRLEGVKVQQVSEGSRAAAAGWAVGDVVISVDGENVSSQWEITEALQRGGPRKTCRVRRGEQTLDTVLDYSDDSSEAEREARLARRAAYLQSPAPR